MPQKQKNKARTKLQHFVPRLHLKRFIGSSPKGMLWTYDMRRGHVRPSRPEGTGAQSNFYSVQDDGGNYIDELDDWLTDVETKAAPIYDDLIAGRIPTGQRRADFSTFIASLYARSPALLRLYAQMSGMVAQRRMQLATRKRERFEEFFDEFEADTGKKVSVSRDELFEFVNDPSRYFVEMDRKSGLRGMRVSDRIQEILFNRPWHLVRALEGEFISCDSPVTRYVPGVQADTPLGDGGFMNPRSEVTLPLTPNLLLLITGQNYSRTLFVDERSVNALNRVRAANAECFLYANRKCEKILKLARDFADVQLEGLDMSGGPFAEVVVRDRMTTSGQSSSDKDE